MTEGEKRPFIRVFWDLWDDKRLSCNEKVVLISLLRHYNTEKRRAWPSHEKIGEEIDRSRRVVLQTLQLLEAKGYIRTEKHAGKVTYYELPFVYVPITNRNSTYSETEQVEERPVTDHNNTCYGTEQVPVTKRNNTCSETEHEQDKRTKSIRTRSIELNTAALESDFEVFWQAYPKPQNPDKSPGRQRYIALRKKGVSAEDLLKAAQGYAVAMRGTQPRYIKHCATFLGPQEPWKDFLNAPERQEIGELPDAEVLFPHLAAWVKKNGGKL